MDDEMGLMYCHVVTEEARCAGCMNQLNEQDYVTALGQDWHTDCFRCCACDAALSSWYLEKDGLLFCQEDYWARYGECCRQCTQVMTGPVMVAGEHRFHPECFACAACSAFIEDGEPYALLERSKLYCGGCYKNFMQPLSRGRPAHSIRIVEMPPVSSVDGSHQIRLAASDKRGPITADYACRGVTIQESPHHSLRAKLSMLVRGLLRAALSLCIQLTCNRMDASCGLMTLHIGDRILEINGTPIHNQPIDEIERVLCCSDTVLQLTIEHDPDNAAFNKPYQRCRLSIDEPKLTKHASDTRSRIERKQMKMDETNKSNIPTKHSINEDNLQTHSNFKDIDLNSNQRQTALVTDVTSTISPVTTEEPILNSEGVSVTDDGRVKERLFKRKGDGQNSKGRVIRRRHAPDSPLEKERSSSMSKLLDAVGAEESGVLCDLSRARSFRADAAANQRVFRAADLLQGELLGCGFFGQVYKVTHRDTAEVMVLKQLYRVDEDAQKNFLKEVAVLRSLSHPNVLRFVGVLYKDKRLHLVTEYVAGGTLQQLLQESDAALCWAVRARLARDIAAGVGYLHRMNVIHRDLNSLNCLVREDKTVIVADFGLARIVQRTASSAAERHAPRSSTLSRRKRYTVVGNPYWMAPEMMKGNRYDEKVDVFSFGIVLCEIIGRVQADPDYLPRRSDFGLNELVFRDKFCRGCPEPLCRLAFLCCDLNPDARPPFEVIEIWLESLVMHLSTAGAPPAGLLADIQSYQQGARAQGSPERGVPASAVLGSGGGAVGSGGGGEEASALAKSKPNTPEVTTEAPVVIRVEETIPERSGRALGKCVSAGQICRASTPAAAAAAAAALSRSQNALHAPAGYILRAHGTSINITKVRDISEWVDPPAPLKRSSPDLTLGVDTKTRRLDCDVGLPAFLRNQSVEGLESDSKNDVDVPHTFCRHFSITDQCEAGGGGPDDSRDDSDASDDDAGMCTWYQRVSGEAAPRGDARDVRAPKLVVDIVENGKKFLDDTEPPQNVVLRHPPRPGTNERKISELDKKRYNIDQLNKTPGVSAGIKHLQQKFAEMSNVKKPPEKTNFFTKKLLSPKLGRLFKPNTSEVDRKKTDETKSPRMLSKFFVQRPASPSSYRVRPVDASQESKEQFTADTNTINRSVLDSDIKLASLGKPLTPIFRRHFQSDGNRFQDGRFSCRDHRTVKAEVKQEPKFAELRRSRVISPGTVLRVDASKLSPLSRCTNTCNIPALSTTVNGRHAKTHAKDSNDVKVKEPTKKKDIGISRGNYVSLANLKINGKPKDLEKIAKINTKPKVGATAVNIPLERVI